MDPEPGKEIEVYPDPAKYSGSETLLMNVPKMVSTFFDAF